MAVKYFSMFSGIGGFELGIQYACNQQPAQIEQDGQGGNRNSDEVEHDVLPTSRTTPLCIGYSEIDKYAIKVYERRFSGHKNYGDATAINPTDLPDFDLLVGGFPCQAFSIAGKRAGFDDTRGTLFFDIARILKEKQPRHLVLENVKGLLSHDSGRTFTTIIGVLTDMGYLVEWQVLNSKNFGVPQNRERVYIVGHLGNECGRKVFPVGTSNREDTTTIKLYNRRSVSQRNKPSTIQEKEKKTNSYRIRRLTPLECERLQGFPDNWTKYGVKQVLMQQSEERPWPKNGTLTEMEEISDTQRYKMCGNAVTVNTVQAVIERLIPCL